MKKKRRKTIYKTQKYNQNGDRKAEIQEKEIIKLKQLMTELNEKCCLKRKHISKQARIMKAKI